MKGFKDILIVLAVVGTAIFFGVYVRYGSAKMAMIGTIVYIISMAIGWILLEGLPSVNDERPDHSS